MQTLATRQVSKPPSNDFQYLFGQRYVNTEYMFSLQVIVVAWLVIIYGIYISECVYNEGKAQGKEIERLHYTRNLLFYVFILS